MAISAIEYGLIGALIVVAIIGGASTVYNTEEPDAERVEVFEQMLEKEGAGVLMVKVGDLTLDRDCATAVQDYVTEQKAADDYFAAATVYNTTVEPRLRLSPGIPVNQAMQNTAYRMAFANWCSQR